MRVVGNGSPKTREVSKDISSILPDDELLHRPDGEYDDLGAPAASEREAEALFAIACGRRHVGARVVRISVLELLF